MVWGQNSFGENSHSFRWHRHGTPAPANKEEYPEGLLGDLGGNDADLEVIEVQNGEYLGEDDIVRLEDIWEREQRKR
jgi:hypothetical protein